MNRARHAGAWWLAAMGVFLIAAGAFFAWRMWLSYEKTSVSRAWTATPCHVDSSRIVSARETPASALTHRVEISYSYEAGGRTWKSTRIRHVEAAPTAHLDKARALQQQYPPGTQRLCHVNPADPSQSVLLQGSRAALYSIWFPLLFVIGGAGMIWGVMRPRRPAA
ncbi:MAG: DUF3592 domain-containing protein [Verrucomicrobiaceae bacterium]|nr:DUF3592 domain-containing protein [Verrucomicrobiaceae bacterium]